MGIAVSNDKIYTSYFAVADRFVLPEEQVSIAVSCSKAVSIVR